MNSRHLPLPRCYSIKFSYAMSCVGKRYKPALVKLDRSSRPLNNLYLKDYLNTIKPSSPTITINASPPATATGQSPEPLQLFLPSKIRPFPTR